MIGPRRYVVLILVALAAIGLQVLFATAQQPGQPGDREVELVGFVEAMDATTITINGQVIELAGAEIETPLSVGTAVEVEGTIGSDGRIVAREVDDAGRFEPDSVQLTGVVQSFDGAALALGGLTMNAAGADVNANAVVPGALVRVHLIQADDGSLVVRDIRLPGDDDDDDNDNDDNNDDPSRANDDNNDDFSGNNNDDSSGRNNDDSSGIRQGSGGFGILPDNEFVIVGTLQGTGTGTIAVFGQTIDTSQAEIRGALIPGTLVRVHVASVNGQLVARNVRFADLDDRDDDLDDDDFGTVGAFDNRDNFDSANLISTCGVPAGWTTYTIRRGDSLSGIAARSATTVNDLTTGNCILANQMLQPGQVIAVPRTPVEFDDDSGSRGFGQGDGGSGSRIPGGGINDDNSGRNNNDDPSGNNDTSSGRNNNDDPSGRIHDDSSGSGDQNSGGDDGSGDHGSN